MAKANTTPVLLIDEVRDVEAINGQLIVTLSSYGAPHRLTIEPRNAAILGRWLRDGANEATEQRHNSSVVHFPAKRRRKAA